ICRAIHVQANMDAPLLQPTSKIRHDARSLRAARLGENSSSVNRGHYVAQALACVVLPASIQQELAVALLAQDRPLHQFRAESQRFDGLADSIARSLVQLGLPHDSSFPHLIPAHFKLGLY